MITVLLLVASTLTLDEAVARAKEAAAAKDGPAALEIEAERREDGAIEFDDVRVGVEHRNVDRFFDAQIDDETGAPFSALDNVAVGATLPVPRLDDLVKKSAADLVAGAARSELTENARDLAADVRRLVVDVAALKRERALLTQALATAQQREALLQARRDNGTATILLVDDAARERLGVAADVVGVDDDLQSARADLAELIDGDDDVDDDLDARCQQPLPGDDEALALARSNDPRQEKLRLVDEALQREELAAWLAFVPWPDRAQVLFIHRDDGHRDDLRVGVDFNLPLLRFLDGRDDGLALRRAANAKQRAVLDARLERQVAQARLAVGERRKMVGLLALPAVGAVPEDAAEAAEIELHRNLAERRRLRAIARCARSVVDLLSLISE
jgi:hypothetical protein